MGITSLTAGVDWFSATLDAEAEDLWLWGALCYKAVESLQQEGYKKQFHKRLGYEGVECGNCFAGSRHDGFLVQMRGKYADSWFYRLQRRDLHITRLDLQVTCQYDVMPEGMGESLYDMACAANGRPQAARARRIWYMSGQDGGYTIYIGSPSSEQRGRIYNKEAQSEDPQYVRCWRWEVEYKGDIATTMGDILQSYDGSHHAVVANTVQDWYKRRGVIGDWYDIHRAIVLPNIRRLPSDAERTLEWIEHQVAPAIRSLVKRGYGEYVSAVLGIDMWA